MRSLPKLAAIALVLGAAQLQAQGMNMAMDKPAAAATSLPFVKAEVRKVDAARGMVTLKHEDIPNLGMSAMTMAFEVADKKMLKGIKAGDKVRFQIDSVKGKPLVIELERSK
jgi:Cu(I)/Ag(I) efflux system membrane protein CusA/SilA